MGKYKHKDTVSEPVVQSFAHVLISNSQAEFPLEVKSAKIKKSKDKTQKKVEDPRQAFESYAVYCFQRLCNTLKKLRETGTISQEELERCGNELCSAFEEYINYGFDRGMTAKDLERELNVGLNAFTQLESQRAPDKSVIGMLFDNFFG